MMPPGSDAAPAGQPPSERVNVLIVDDQPDKLLSLEAALASLGENIVLAKSGRDALRRLLEHDFAVILLDVNMPDMDGFETAALIRQHRRCTHTPIIFVTAFGDDMHTAQGYSLGAVDYILSPIVPDILRTKVRVFVDLFRKTQEIERHAEARVNLAREQAARAAAEDSNRQLNFLSEASAAMTRHLSTDATIAEINRVAVPFLADFSAIALLDEQHQLGKCDAAWATPVGNLSSTRDELWQRLPAQLRGSIKEAIDNSQARLGRAGFVRQITISAADITGDQGIGGNPLHVFAILPLSARGRTIGALVLASNSLETTTAVGHFRLVEDFANRASIAIDNARLYENVREHDRRKDHFLAMLGHELRNPLAPIRNAVEILRCSAQVPGTTTDTGSIQAREMIERQVAHMTRLIDDLLDVSRIASGKIQLRRERCDLTKIVKDTLEDYRSVVEQSGLQLTLELPQQSLWIQGDRTRMSQIVGNLIHNAHKFTDEGGQVLVRLLPETDGRSALLTIRDSGIGMDRETLSSVFDAFSQADRSLERSRGGLGLGLALVKGLVELHGGAVCVSSEGLGRGTEFRVQLFLDQSVVASQQSAPRATTKGKSCRILIIEDNLDGAESMRLLLRHLGHEVKVAHTGPSGLAVATEWSPEVVLCDIGLPGGMDGYAVARALREETHLDGLLLIALTGYGRDDDQRRAKEAGFDQHMTKPVDFAVLQRTLTSFSHLCQR
ncbi:Autoinducer 2 sensor kinase/phosphatase LuxQ [Anatilimnocola aggregata]|uniref:histidine kinase n=1 Tax=Anatilimnocola aggregata TaxID=2528021 RepID=A0A517YEW0_9BACT|nr:response regulator [Anatilimnocola aggregata]QDU28758.1 Autoinducer 2 sensor kinase/phosphatase LuxQ [Anatilimnocola aggregata]